MLPELAMLALALLVVGMLAVDRLARRPDWAIIALLTVFGLLEQVSGFIGAFTGAETLTAPRLVVGRLATALLVGAAVLVLARPRRNARGPALSLVISALLFYGVCTVVPVITGTETVDVLESMLLAAVVPVVLWAAPRLSPYTAARYIKIALGLTLIGSLVTMLAGAPDAWWSAAASVSFGDARLRGLTHHPNALGPLIVFYLFLEYRHPSRRWVRYPLVLLAVVELILTQSKTSWLAAVFAGVVAWMGTHRSRRQRLAGGTVMVLVCLLLVGYVALSNDDLPAQTFGRFRTLTGRTPLWQLGLDAWLDHPVVGSGPQVFVSYATSSGQTWAGQAHNQFVQVLAQYGLIGFVAVFVFMVMIARSAWRTRRVSGGLTSAFAAIVLLRCVTETPLSAMTLELVILLTELIAWERYLQSNSAVQVGETRGFDTLPSALPQASPTTRGPIDRQPVHGQVAVDQR